MFDRIVAFNRGMGGGVLIEKRSHGYSLLRHDNGRPIARLRPFGKDGLVEILWWSHRGKWERIGDMGPMVMPLEAALKYIAKAHGYLLGLMPPRLPGICRAAASTELENGCTSNRYDTPPRRTSPIGQHRAHSSSEALRASVDVTESSWLEASGAPAE